MRKLLPSVSALLAAILGAPKCPASAMTNVFGRASTSLNGRWQVIVDPYDMGYYDYRYVAYDQAENPTGGFFLDRRPRDKTDLVEYAFTPEHTLIVPRDWNSQEEKLALYEGAIWYRRAFDRPSAPPGSRWFVHFGAANYQADVYLNGRKLGRHIGGFTPFEFEITDAIREQDNVLIVRVDNRRERAGVPTLNTDWWNYGGLTREIRLVSVPATFIADYSIALAPDSPDRLLVRARLDGPERRQKLQLLIPDLQVSTDIPIDADGTGRAEVAVQGLERWSPDHPRRYEVTLAGETDRVSELIGFRTIATRGPDILLNGAPVFLRGICIHEENPLEERRACTPEDARLLLGWARELGCNFVRLAHYPHNEYMVRLADELGLMVWEEIPVYWTIQWENPDTLANARRQLAEAIARDRNRASVIIWSVANETPVGAARTRFLRTLVEDARALDGTRLVSAAMEVHPAADDPDTRIVDDPFGEYTDLVSFNEYVGWYDGLPDRLDRLKWRIAQEKPVVVTEFGAGALAGFHADDRTRFSEEFQEDLYRRTLAMLQRIPNLRGFTPWILVDFRSPRRLLPEIQDGWNRKGLIGAHGEHKRAFYVLQQFYREQAARAHNPASE